MAGTTTTRRLSIGILIGAIIAFPLGAFGAKAWLAKRPLLAAPASANSSTNGSSSLFLTEGFDFSSIRNAEWHGPDPGARIDLARFKRRDGKSLADLINKQPIVVVSVHPECGMCAASRDEMIHLTKKFSSMNLKYYVVSFASTPASDFFTYSESLNIGVDAFLWDATSGPAPEQLFTMTNPSHLLLAADGTVIRVWPGSNPEKSVRQRMARQILSDTSVILDTLNAFTSKPGSPSR
jgi:peroxiredoxin